MFQNRQVIVSSFGCCWYSGDALESRLLDFLQRPGEDECEWGGGGIEGDSGIFIEDACEEGMQNLGGSWC